MERLIYHPVFFTATIKDWKNLLKPEKYKIIVLNNLKSLVDDNKIILFAYCIMNNHVHLIWQIKGDNSPSEVQKHFLENISKQIKKDLLIYHIDVLKLFASSQKDRSYHFWKRRPLSIELFSPNVFEQKLDYIHNNPVNAGFCQYPEQYPFSGWLAEMAQPRRMHCYVSHKNAPTKAEARHVFYTMLALVYF